MLNKFFVFYLYCLCSLYDDVSAKNYTVVNQKLNYFDAFLSCKRAGLDLVSIETVEEWQLIGELLDSLGYGNQSGNLLWTSANSLNEPHSGNFSWMSNGSPIISDFWSPNQPDDANTDIDNNEYCVNIQHYKGKYGTNDYNCYKEIEFICEASEEKSRYLVAIKEKVNYFEAAFACKRMETELASIETEEEWRYIIFVLRNLGYGNDDGNVLWTSGNSLNELHSKNFFWLSDGSAIYSNNTIWSSGQPDDANDGEFCVNVRIRDGEYGINDFDCYNKIGYICEGKRQIAIDAIEDVPAQ